MDTKTLTDDQLKILEEIRAGLSKERKTLPSKLFYDERGSKLFDEICELEEYYPTRTELKIMEDNIEDIVDTIPQNSLLIELGSGSSVKIRLILDRLKKIAAYVPIDISEEHLLKSADELRKDYPNVPIRPVAADYTKSFDLPPVEEKYSTRLVYFPGSTVGNFTKREAKEFLRVVRDLCGDDGYLLIGVDLKKDRAILEAAYNDAKGVTAEFNLNMLKRLNEEFDCDFNLNNFRHEAIYNDEEGRIEMRLISLNDHEASCGDNSFHFREGEFITTEYSHKYSLKDFADLAGENFEVIKVWTDEKNLFSVQALKSL